MDERIAQSHDEAGVEALVPRMKDDGYDAERVGRRREWLERTTGTRLPHIGTVSFDTELMRGNIENPIGVAQIPLGIAGPVMIHGECAEGLFYVPMATTEGALIRSYERGMIALTRAGGVQTAVLADENHTAPVLFFGDISEARAFCRWIPAHLAELQIAASETTRHGRLQGLECHQSGRNVILDLRFSTGDAQGMNMIVKATESVCRWIERSYPISGYHLFSGFCAEKRAAAILLTRGKGKHVTAGALLPHSVLKMYLHVSAVDLHRVWQSTVIGHLHAGAIGYNAHAANGLSAIFIAAGQDVANVVNSACVITSFELVESGLYASITIPALSIATVGGGTGLPAQREALQIMDCYGSGKAPKFAEIVAATLLGGEISMGAAIASGEFVAAHERYGRNRPK